MSGSINNSYSSSIRNPIKTIYVGGSSTSSGGGGTNYWTLSGNNIYNNNTGSVGINTSTPDISYNLDVSGSVRIRGDLIVDGSSTIIDTNILKVEDPLIHLGINNLADLKAGGYYVEYRDISNNKRYTGMVRPPKGTGYVLLNNSIIEPSDTYPDISTLPTSFLSVERIGVNKPLSSLSSFYVDISGLTRIWSDRVLIGSNAGNTGQNSNAISIGNNAGNSNQGLNSVAIGLNAAYYLQQPNAVAIGRSAGAIAQSQNTVAMGYMAGEASQNTGALSLGFQAGRTFQGTNSIAIGVNAGEVNQGCNSIAIGNQAAQNNQCNNTIVLNASGVSLNPTNINGFYVDPIRNVINNKAVYYNTFTKEITYSDISNGGITSLPQGNVYGEYLLYNGANWFVDGSRNVAIGYNSGRFNQDISAVAIGFESGYTGQGSNAVAIGNQAGNSLQGSNSIAIGLYAGKNSQGASSIAIGFNAGQIDQSGEAVAIGRDAGYRNQGSQSVAIGIQTGVEGQRQNAVAIGSFTGTTNQGTNSIAIGYLAGRGEQGSNAIAIGQYAGDISQNSSTVAIGEQAGYIFQGTTSIAIGNSAGRDTQRRNSVAIGNSAGNCNQGTSAISIGFNSGYENQAQNTIALGESAGFLRQKSNAIAIGKEAGNTDQSSNAIAIGSFAGNGNQGSNSIALGNLAGFANQGSFSVAIGYGAGSPCNNSIVLNATNGFLDSTSANALYINPIRNASQTNYIGYNTGTKELTYFDTISNVNITDISAIGATTYYPTFVDGSGNKPLYIDSTNTLSYRNQNFGIGTKTPSATLDVSGDMQTNGNMIMTGSESTRQSIIMNPGGQAASLVIARQGVFINNVKDYIAPYTNNNAGGGCQLSFGTGDMTFSNFPDSSFNNPISLTERMRITKSGNVGIGTTNPSSKLTVNSNDANAAISINRYNKDGPAYLYFGATDGSEGIPTSVTGGRTIGYINFTAYNGTKFIGSVASVAANVDSGPVSSTNMPGNLRFYTRPPNDVSDTNAALQTYERMRITSGGNVGIGTIVPSTTLDVSGTGRISGDFIVDTNTLFVDSSNNRVGIGTTTPTEKLTINSGNVFMNGSFNGMVMNPGASAGSLVITRGGEFTNNVTGFADISGTSTIYRDNIGGASGGGAQISLLKNEMSFSTFPTGTLGNPITLTERMRITSTGVGINTTTPASTLDVSGTANITGNFTVDISNLFVDAFNNRVGIGTTTPGYKLHVEGSGTANEIVGWFNNQGQFSSSIAVRQASKTAYITNHNGLGGPNYDDQLSNAISFGVSSGASPIQFWNGNTGLAQRGTAKMTILDGSGNVGIGTNAPTFQLQLSRDSAAKPTSNTWTISSDQRVKTNIENADLDRCNEIVENLSLKRFQWSEKYFPNVDDRNSIGFIAQEVEQYFPNAVKTHKNKFLLQKGETEEENIYEEIEDFKSLDIDQLIKCLFGSVKYLQNQVKTLVQKNETLEQRIAKLE